MLRLRRGGLRLIGPALNFLRVSTIGELLILAGNLLMLGNRIRLSVRYYQTHFVPAYKEATAELKPAEGKT